MGLELDAEGIVKIIKACKSAGVTVAKIGDIDLSFGNKEHSWVHVDEPTPKMKTQIQEQEQEVSLPTNQEKHPEDGLGPLVFDEFEYEHITDPAAWQRRQQEPGITTNSVEEIDEEA